MMNVVECHKDTPQNICPLRRSSKHLIKIVKNIIYILKGFFSVLKIFSKPLMVIEIMSVL